MERGTTDDVRRVAAMCVGGAGHRSTVVRLLIQEGCAVLHDTPNSRIGNLIATALAGSWRRSPQGLELSERVLTEVAPQLVGSMSAALVWRRIRGTGLEASPAGAELQQASRFHAVLSLLRERAIKKVLAVLYSERVEPILVKGWAAASLYPEPALRPYGDIDLVVRPEEYSAASAAISTAISSSEIEREYYIDLHCGFEHLDNRSFDELCSRSRVIPLDDVDVRVLSAEDHLRVLSVHLLHHNAFRPLWLCDIAAAVEGRSSDFNWDRCLGVKRRSCAVTCAIGLAHVLLGARVSDTPVAPRVKELPKWLVSNVLKQWEIPFSSAQQPVTHHAPMSKYLRNPRGLLQDLRRRWPKPIEATVYMGGPFNAFPRWPFQVGECIGRAGKFVAQLPRTRRE